jgi:hypothetical protein
VPLGQSKCGLVDCTCPPNSGTLSPHKQPANAVALLALPITRQSITCARGAFLPVILIQRASNDTPTGLSICSLAAGLTDARSAVGRRSAFCTSAYWHLSPAHTLSLSGPIVRASGLAPAARSRSLCGRALANMVRQAIQSLRAR